MLIRELKLYLDVSHPVVVEVGRGGESLAANGALVGLLAAVDPPVGVERARRREPLAAHVAHVGLLAWRERETKPIETVSVLSFSLDVSSPITAFVRDHASETRKTRRESGQRQVSRASGRKNGRSLARTVEIDQQV